MGDRGVELLRSKGYVGVYVSVLEESDNLSFENHPRRVIGVIGIVDQIEKNAESTILALQSMGIDVWMCTGDHFTTARAVAGMVGIEESNICADVTPEGKDTLIKRLKQRKLKKHGPLSDIRKGTVQGKVAMVGDGINDAIALKSADVGIGIGAGTSVAVESADIVLVKSNLHDVVVALHLSRCVFTRIKVNFFWAMGYNLFAIPFAAGAFYHFTDWRVPPAFAGFMMAFSSVSVVTSSLFLKCYSKPRIDENGVIINQGVFAHIQRCAIQTFYHIASTFSLSKKSPNRRDWESVIV